MVSNIQNQNNLSIQEDNSLQQTLDLVYNNIDQVIAAYGHIINPSTNCLTQKYINEGYNLKEAYALSFTCTLSLYIQIINT